MYNRALRKLKVRNCRMDYLSDSCVPIRTATEEGYNRRQASSLDARTYLQRQQASLQKRRYVKIRTRDSYVQIPTLDIASMHMRNHIQMRLYKRQQQEGQGSEDATLSASLPDGVLAASREQTGSRVHPVDNMVACLNASEGTVSEDSQAKAKLKDIVFDPVKRKRLLDSLNIVTTRNKHQVFDAPYSDRPVQLAD